MEIIEYSVNYKEEVNLLMHEILVEEYGFHQFSKDILNSHNHEYLQGNNKLWLAIENDVIIGTTGIIEMSKEQALLKKIYVKTAYRGKGIAKQLLEHCLTHAKKMGYDSVYLETYHRLGRAKAFYEKNGFKEYHNGYEKIQGDEVRYILKLNEL